MFSDNIKALRLEHGITQDELAEMLLVTRTAVSKWETGKGYPNIDSLRLISEKFNRPIDELLSDEDFKERKKLRTKVPVWFYLSVSLILLVISMFIINVPHGLDYFIGIDYKEKNVVQIDIKAFNFENMNDPLMTLSSESDISEFCYCFKNTEASYIFPRNTEISNNDSTEYSVKLKYKNGKVERFYITDYTFVYSKKGDKAYITGKNALMEYVKGIN